MSLLSRDELRIALLPHSVAMVRLTRGWRPRMRSKRAFPCDSDEGASWRGAVAALRAALAEPMRKPSSTTVVLSNHFVHYLVVPWSDALVGSEQERAYVLHHFRQVYGETADSWEIRIDDNTRAESRLVSAVDARLLHSVRELAQQARLPLTSIQPYLMTRLNTCWASLRRRNGWLALGEPGMLCLALRQQGRWVRLRTMRASSQWLSNLPALLDRETYLTEGAVNERNVLVSAPGLDDFPLPSAHGWQMTRLQCPHSVLAAEDARFSMAVGG